MCHEPRINVLADQSLDMFSSTRKYVLHNGKSDIGSGVNNGRQIF